MLHFKKPVVRPPWVAARPLACHWPTWSPSAVKDVQKSLEHMAKRELRRNKEGESGATRCA